MTCEEFTGFGRVPTVPKFWQLVEKNAHGRNIRDQSGSSHVRQIIVDEASKKIMTPANPNFRGGKTDLPVVALVQTCQPGDEDDLCGKGRFDVAGKDGTVAYLARNNFIKGEQRASPVVVPEALL
jgi:hypothetical protein